MSAVIPNPTDELAEKIDQIRLSQKGDAKYTELHILVAEPVFEAVEIYFATPPARIKSRDATLYANRARLAAYWLLSYAGLYQAEIAAITSRCPSSVSKGLDQVEALIDFDPSFRSALERAKKSLAEN